MLKFTYDKQEDVPAEAVDFYKEVGGKWVLQVEGAKSVKDVENVQEALRKERKDHSTTKQALATYKELGDDPEELREQLDSIPALQAGNKDADPKVFQEKVEAEVVRRVAKSDREKAKAEKERDEAIAENNSLKASNKSRDIKEALRKAAVEAKVIDTAVDDVLLYEGMFDLGEDGKVITKDNVGIAPGLEPSAWISDLSEKKPHWWAQSQGSGANGDRAKGFVPHTGPNPFTFEAWNLTEQSKLIQSNRKKAEQLAQLAGTSIGGPKPAPKK